MQQRCKIVVVPETSKFIQVQRTEIAVSVIAILSKTQRSHLPKGVESDINKVGLSFGSFGTKVFPEK